MKPLLTDAEIDALGSEEHPFDGENIARLCDQAKLAALPRSEPKEAGVLEAFEAVRKVVNEAPLVVTVDWFFELGKALARLENLLPAAPAKSAPKAVAQVLASSLGATENGRLGEAKGNAEGTAPVKPDAEGGWQPTEPMPTNWGPNQELYWLMVYGPKNGMLIIQFSQLWNYKEKGWTHYRPLPAPPPLGDL